MNATKILWTQVLVVCSVALAFVWGATQWTAAALGYQAQLGRPWFRFDGWPVYHPPAFFWWWFAYDAYAPQVSVYGAYIAASGGLAEAVVVASKLATETALLISPPPPAIMSPASIASACSWPPAASS